MGIAPIPERRSSLRSLLVCAAVVALALSAAAPAAASGPVPPKYYTVSVGSNWDADPDLSGFASMMSYCGKAAGATPAIHTYPNADFNNGILDYLGGYPDSLVTWFGGERMRYFAAKGLLTPIPDVWRKVSGNYSPAMRALSTGVDGKPYFIPTDTYPWVVMYRKSVFAAHGYTVPKTWTEFLALAAKMQQDGLIPLALGDRDGWPAMGTFDILDMRLNGYAFHEGLMAGTQQWTDPKVKAVFTAWKQLLPYTPNPTANYWWESAIALMDGSAGMDFTGTFAAWVAPDDATYNDLGMFTFPLLGTAYDAELAIDAPVDGLVLSTNTFNLAGAEKLLACAASGAAQLRFTTYDRSLIPAARTAGTSTFTPFQKQMAAAISGSKAIGQFLDRDSRPDFTGPDGMQAFLASFLENSGQDLDAFLGSIQAYWDALPPQ